MRNRILFAPLPQLILGMERRFKKLEEEEVAIRRSDHYEELLEMIEELERRNVEEEILGPYLNRLFGLRHKRKKHHSNKNTRSSRHAKHVYDMHPCTS